MTEKLTIVFVFVFSLMDAGRLFYTDSTNAMKKDHTAPVLKSFTQVCSTCLVLMHMKESLLGGGGVAWLARLAWVVLLLVKM